MIIFRREKDGTLVLGFADRKAPVDRVFWVVILLVTLGISGLFILYAIFKKIKRDWTTKKRL